MPYYLNEKIMEPEMYFRISRVLSTVNENSNRIQYKQ